MTQRSSPASIVRLRSFSALKPSKLTEIVEVEDAAMADVDAIRCDAAAEAAGAVADAARKEPPVSLLTATSFATEPAMPRGRNSVTRMNTSPRENSQYSGSVCVNQLLPRLTTAAPMTGPISVPRPPTAVQIAISIELAATSRSG